MKFTGITVNENLNEAVTNIKRVGITVFIAFLGPIYKDPDKFLSVQKFVWTV